MAYQSILLSKNVEQKQNCIMHFNLLFGLAVRAEVHTIFTKTTPGNCTGAPKRNLQGFAGFCMIFKFDPNMAPRSNSE